jgi:hypothetical protein
VKEQFKKVVIPSPFASGVEDGLADDNEGDNGDTEIRVCAPCDGLLIEHVELHDNENRIAYTADEARAIGRALIAAADHIQHDGQGILASEALELWELAQKLQEAYHEGDLEDTKKRVSSVAAFITNFKLEAFRNRPRTVNYDLPEDNS